MRESVETKTGKYGVECVKAILRTRHFEKLKREGCTGYRIIDTDEKNTVVPDEWQERIRAAIKREGIIKENQCEIDIIEEWKDADGKLHRRAHEVKCETPTLDALGKIWKRRQAEKVKKLWEKYTSVGDHPTGNICLELLQDMPSSESNTRKSEIENIKYGTGSIELPEGLKKYEGWILRIINTQEYIAEQYNEGRELWYVLVAKSVDDEIRDEPVVIEIDDAEGFIKTKRTPRLVPAQKTNGCVSWNYLIPLSEVILEHSFIDDDIPVMGVPRANGKFAVTMWEPMVPIGSSL